MRRELLPCPFCGGQARLWPVIMPFDADCDVITVQCGECDVTGAEVLVDQDVHTQSDLPHLEAEAVAQWNRRYNDTAMIGMLREALDTAHRVVLWAARRAASPAYAEVLENDARNLASVIAKANDEQRGHLVAPSVPSNITYKGMTA